MTNQIEVQPPTETPAPAPAPRKRKKSSLPNFSNSVRVKAPDTKEVGAFTFAVRTPYSQLETLIKSYVKTAKENNITPDFIEGRITLVAKV